MSPLSAAAQRPLLPVAWCAVGSDDSAVDGPALRVDERQRSTETPDRQGLIIQSGVLEALTESATWRCWTCAGKHPRSPMRQAFVDLRRGDESDYDATEPTTTSAKTSVAQCVLQRSAVHWLATLEILTGRGPALTRDALKNCFDTRRSHDDAWFSSSHNGHAFCDLLLSSRSLARSRPRSAGGARPLEVLASQPTATSAVRGYFLMFLLALVCLIGATRWPSRLWMPRCLSPLRAAADHRHRQRGIRIDQQRAVASVALTVPPLVFSSFCLLWKAPFCAQRRWQRPAQRASAASPTPNAISIGAQRAFDATTNVRSAQHFSRPVRCQHHTGAPCGVDDELNGRQHEQSGHHRTRWTAGTAG